MTRANSYAQQFSLAWSHREFAFVRVSRRVVFLSFCLRGFLATTAVVLGHTYYEVHIRSTHTKYILYDVRAGEHLEASPRRYNITQVSCLQAVFSARFALLLLLTLRVFGLVFSCTTDHPFAATLFMFPRPCRRRAAARRLAAHVMLSAHTRQTNRARRGI